VAGDVTVTVPPACSTVSTTPPAMLSAGWSVCGSPIAVIENGPERVFPSLTIAPFSPSTK